jgi:hypothetical protein
MMLCVVDTVGQDNCIHDSKKNPAGVPFSICPNAFVCNFSSVKIPGNGYYGLLIVDLDALPSSQDYMVAAILRNGGPEDPEQAWKIEKAIKVLAGRWHVVGAPDEFPQSDAGECTAKNPCFGDSRAGVPSIAISSQEVGVCGMPIKGNLQFGPGNSAGSVDFNLQLGENECPGTLEFMWNFGDGTISRTMQPHAGHAYQPGSYVASVVPRCVRKLSACDAKPASTAVIVGH